MSNTHDSTEEATLVCIYLFIYSEGKTEQDVMEWRGEVERDCEMLHARLELASPTSAPQLSVRPLNHKGNIHITKENTCHYDEGK